MLVSCPKQWWWHIKMVINVLQSMMKQFCGFNFHSMWKKMEKSWFQSLLLSIAAIHSEAILLGKPSQVQGENPFCLYGMDSTRCWTLSTGISIHAELTVSFSSCRFFSSTFMLEIVSWLEIWLFLEPCLYVRNIAYYLRWSINLEQHAV